MRLLHFVDGEFKFKEFRDEDTPPYAILSHTWSKQSQEEVLYEDIINNTAKSRHKLELCRDWAKDAGYEYFWVDTCCINKNSDAELSRSIRLMWKWYKEAAVCFVYLSDLSLKKRKAGAEDCDLKSCAWFTRGWTLQELIASENMVFFARDGRLGTKAELMQQLRDITGIDPLGPMPGMRTRLEWVSNRATTEPEDKAYCMLGICDVALVPMYGEGGDNAWQRLQQEITKVHGTKALQGSKPTPLEHRQIMLEAVKFEAIETRRNTVKVAMSRTCAWIKKNPACARWLKMEHKFFWIKGKPGAGKSVLMKYLDNLVTKTLKRGNAIGLYFYFNARGEQLEKSFEGLYRSLLYQLVTLSPELASCLDQLRQKFEIADLQRVLADAFRKLDREVWLFIDALDECREEDVQDLVDFFDELRDAKLYVCFASRHYPIVEVPTELQLVLEENSEHDRDLGQYIDNLKLRGEQLEQMRVEMLEKANGIFLWVVLVVDILNKELRAGRSFAVRQKLHQMPKGLPELFKTIIGRDDDNKEDFILCLRWILYAKRPLQLREWYFAMMAGLNQPLEYVQVNGLSPKGEGQRIAVSPSDEEMLLYLTSSSKGLAELTKGKKITAQFIHESVRDFLVKDDGFQEICEGQTGASYAHDQLKRCCLRGLAYDLEQLHIRKTKSKPNQEEQRSELMNRFPFAAYAAAYILHHANEAALRMSQDAWLIDEFDVATWVKKYNILRPSTMKACHDTGAPSKATLTYICADKSWERLLSAPYYATTVAGPRDGTALMLACCAQRWDMIELFIDEECSDSYQVQAILSEGRSTLIQDIDWASTSIKKPWQWALRNGLEALSQFLLRSGSQSQNVSEWADGILLASKSGNLSLVGSLLHAHNLVDRSTLSHASSTVLVHAVHEQNIPLIELLLQYKAECNGRWGYRSLLSIAVSHKDVYVVGLLLDHGAKLATLDREAMKLVFESSQESLLELLREKGVSAGPWPKDALEDVVLLGCEDLVQQLLDQGIDGNPDYRAIICTAVTRGYGSIALMLLDRGRVHVCDILSSCSEAAANGHEDCLRMLLDWGADVYPWGGRALFNAARNGHQGIVQLLIDRGVNDDTMYARALRDAASNGHESIVRLLLDRGTIGIANDGEALLRAAQNGHERVLRLLFDRGPIPAAWNEIALREAAGNGHESVVRLLLNRGAIIDADGGPALRQAAFKGYENIVRLLLDQGVTAEAGEGATALREAAFNGHESIVRLLLDRGATVEAGGAVALVMAASTGHEGVVRLLLQRGASVHWKDDFSDTALGAAASQGRTAIVRLLIDHGAHVDVRGGRLQSTPLAEAARNRHAETVQFLLSVSADIDARDINGRTPLMAAAMLNNLEVVRLLISGGATLHSQNYYDRTALSIAQPLGDQAIAEMLMDSGWI